MLNWECFSLIENEKRETKKERERKRAKDKIDKKQRGMRKTNSRTLREFEIKRGAVIE